MRERILYIFLLLGAISLALPSQAKSYLLQGIVRDSISMEPLSGASILVEKYRTGTITDDDGIFQITIPEDSEALTVSFMGYDKKRVPIRKNNINLLDVQLKPVGLVLQEVTVRKKKEKYSKKNNPAVDFMQRIRSHGGENDPRQRDNFSYDKYQKITVGLNNFAEKKENSWIFKKFPFLWENVDTSEVSGKPVLNISVSEESSKVYYRKNPKTEKELVTGVKRDGFDEMLDQESIQTFLVDIMGEVDLMQNDINLLQNRFVSPLGKLAPDFYKFYLTDTIQIEDERFIVLSFVPRTSESFGFVGQIYVEEGDSTMMVKKVSLRIPHNINLNFIDHLLLTQEFERHPNGSQIKTSDDLTMEITIIPGTQGLYTRRSMAFTNHSFQPSTEIDSIKGLSSKVEDSQAYLRDDEFWDSVRSVGIKKGEKNMSNLMTQLRKVPIFYWSEQVLKVMFNGYIPTRVPDTRSKFDFGPMNTTISGNNLEGVRLRVGGMTTAMLSKHWFSRGYVAYGTKDHKWKYKAELEYSFNEKKFHSREFPIHSIMVSHKYDVDQIGQHYLFTNMDNFVLSLKRMPNRQMTYQRLSQLTYKLELQNNFSVEANLSLDRQEATEYMPFQLGDGTLLSHYQEASMKVTLRYAPGEKFYQMRSMRVPINFDAPIITLSHEVAPRGLFNSRYTLNKTELSMQKRFWFSAFGYLDAMVKGSHLWSRAPYPNLCIANANLSYTIQPESFCFLNPLEFVNDSQVEWDATYWANGAIFNRIPLLKKLQLREAFNFKGFWGKLSKKNNPLYDPELFRFPEIAHTKEMTSRPYMEASVGIDNILKCLRLDYVWRLSYRDAPGVKNRSGLRVAMHVAF